MFSSYVSVRGRCSRGTNWYPALIYRTQLGLFWSPRRSLGVRHAASAQGRARGTDIPGGVAGGGHALGAARERPGLQERSRRSSSEALLLILGLL